MITNTTITGLPYPLVKNPSGVFSPLTGTVLLQSSLLSIILTDQGERVMETNFGAGLSDQLFQLQGPAVESTIYNRIIQQIAQYDPRITVTSLTVSATPPVGLIPVDSSNQILYVNLSYLNPQNIAEVIDLTLELPLST